MRVGRRYFLGILSALVGGAWMGKKVKPFGGKPYYLRRIHFGGDYGPTWLYVDGEQPREISRAEAIAYSEGFFS